MEADVGEQLDQDPLDEQKREDGVHETNDKPIALKRS